MDASTTTTTDISATTNALAVPEILSCIVASAVDIRYLCKFRLVSRSFLQACAPFFFIRISDPFSYNGTLSEKHQQIIQSAGHLLREVSLSSAESFFFDNVVSSLHPQVLHLALDNPSSTIQPANRVFAPLFKEGATVGTRLTELTIHIRGESFAGTDDEWSIHCSPRCLLDPGSGLKSRLGSILSRLTSLDISNMYQIHPKPMLWPTMVDIIRNVCPRLTSLKIRRLPLELRLDDSPTKDVFPTLTTLHLGDTLVTIKELIHLSLLFPNVESIQIRMKTSYRSLSSSDCSVVLPFKSVVFGVITSDDLVAVLPMLPWMSRLLIDQFDRQSSVAAVVEAFKSLGARNQFKELQFPFQWSKAELKAFIQLDCLRSLELFKIWNSAQEFLEAVGTGESLENQEAFELSTPTTTTATAPPTAITAITTTTTPVATHVLPVFLETIKVLNFKVYMGRGARRLTSTHMSVLKFLLKKMPRIESFSLHRELLSDLTIFDGLESSHVPLLRRIHIAFAAISGPLTPEMITTQIIDRLAPSLRILEVSLQGPQAIMKKPWAKKLEQWFEDRAENRTEDDLLQTHLTRSMWS
ncbi:MAG: hypothetical protein J3R72DRAFT_453042 [Linnemannia gamsii]|nr:MAG: hypothetical protein J3R72DRAFT_453042 [Linnemannia gamsii]